MMKFNLAAGTGANYISEYRGNAIVINGVAHQHAVIVADAHLAEWRVDGLQSLSMTDFEDVLALAPDIVVLGCGNDSALPPLDIIAAFSQRGIGLEFMTTDAACRTYNVLRSEDRSVVAALLLN